MKEEVIVVKLSQRPTASKAYNSRYSIGSIESTFLIHLLNKAITREKRGLQHMAVYKSSIQFNYHSRNRVQGSTSECQDERNKKRGCFPPISKNTDCSFERGMS